ncbi:MATE family efflux transporter [Ideonella livida]|uniref:Multidrug-efflux transporter n=1 Tax=Ideonella livida TaxID=2707176 RepID=A0A7C9PH20_9BURK|nr:MATE family efflux transporter [Ideonella livida]NDY91735.1 MATE family efflux transporter [Ideonella livida]
MPSAPVAESRRAGHGLVRDARRLLPLAWPLLVGQLAVLAFATIDTVVVGRHAPQDLAAYAVGAAAYITIFIGLMGTVLGLSPLVGQLYGAGRLGTAGDQLHQGVWLALLLALPGCGLLLFPQPFLWIARASPELAGGVRGYLLALALALPPALLFTVFRAFNNAVSRPKAVMALQLGGLVVKAPLTVLLVGGAPALGLPSLGVTGAGLGTAAAMSVQLLGALWLLRRDRFYERFELWGRGLHRPDGRVLWAQARLGLPIGSAILIEVSGFAFMALFIARLGPTAVAGHQLVMNLVSLMFMLPLSLANATTTLVAQRIGAGDLQDARRLGWHGLQLGCGVSAALALGVWLAREPVLGLYTGDAAVLAAALPLLAWLVPFHIADAVQTLVAFTLRAWRVAAWPMFIYAGALWGVGLGLGQHLAFSAPGSTPEALRGAPGFWVAATAGLVLASLALLGLKAWVLRHPERVVQARSRR